MHSSGWQINGANLPREANESKDYISQFTLRFNSISILTGSKPFPNTICFSSAVCERVMRTRLVKRKEKKKKEWKRLLVIDNAWRNVWKWDHCLRSMTDWKRGWEFFLPPLFPTFQCTPSYSSTIVHIARSLRTTRPPPSLCSVWRILCIHAAAHSIHRLNRCLLQELQFVSCLETRPSCCKQHRLPTAIALAVVSFIWFFFFLWGRPPDIWHTSGAL